MNKITKANFKEIGFSTHFNISNDSRYEYRYFCSYRCH